MAFDPDEWRLADDVGSWSTPPRAFEEYAWTLVFAVGLALVLAALWEVANGPVPSTSGPAAAPAFLHGYRPVVIAFGLLVMGLAAVPYRRRERWSWALLWLVPAAMLGVALANYAADGALWPAYLGLAAVAATGLVLPVRLLVRRY